MFETYDTNQKAYVERAGQYYDLQQKAWVDVPSAMTYDTTERAWIERMYAGYFYLSDNTSYTVIPSGDVLTIKGSGFVFESAKSSAMRKFRFSLPYTFKVGDVVEFDIVKNSWGRVSIGHNYTSSSGSNTGGTVVTIEDERDEHITGTVKFATGSDAISSYLYVEFFRSTDGYVVSSHVEIKNLTINGKKYGFTE